MVLVMVQVMILLVECRTQVIPANTLVLNHTMLLLLDTRAIPMALPVDLRRSTQGLIHLRTECLLVTCLTSNINQAVITPILRVHRPIKSMDCRPPLFIRSLLPRTQFLRKRRGVLGTIKEESIVLKVPLRTIQGTVLLHQTGNCNAFLLSL